MPQNDKKAAFVRLAVLVIVLINQALVMFGWDPLPYTEQQIYEGVSVVATAIVSIYTWWRNNNASEEALEAQKQLERIQRIKQ
ncbi:phage holin [Bhargavaea ginsengi]|uniref:phage holin n=1 Tax=Bhargavaea ginsengi TaxID=426757 RepID=UPI003C71165C